VRPKGISKIHPTAIQRGVAWPREELLGRPLLEEGLEDVSKYCWLPKIGQIIRPIWGVVYDSSGAMRMVLGRYLSSKVLGRNLGEVFHLARTKRMESTDGLRPVAFNEQGRG
jgi:hypothetical protein